MLTLKSEEPCVHMKFNNVRWRISFTASTRFNMNYSISPYFPYQNQNKTKRLQSQTLICVFAYHYYWYASYISSFSSSSYWCALFKHTHPIQIPQLLWVDLFAKFVICLNSWIIDITGSKRGYNTPSMGPHPSPQTPNPNNKKTDLCWQLLREQRW